MTADPFDPAQPIYQDEPKHGSAPSGPSKGKKVKRYRSQILESNPELLQDRKSR